MKQGWLCNNTDHEGAEQEFTERALQSAETEMYELTPANVRIIHFGPRMEIKYESEIAAVKADCTETVLFICSGGTEGVWVQPYTARKLSHTRFYIYIFYSLYNLDYKREKCWTVIQDSDARLSKKKKKNMNRQKKREKEQIIIKSLIQRIHLCIRLYHNYFY